MKKMSLKCILSVLLIVSFIAITGCGANHFLESSEQSIVSSIADIQENGHYTKAKDVAEYIRQFSHLPSNYVTKREARALGWKPEQGNLGELGENLCIGGDEFGNRENRLPKADKRIYYECDVNYEGGNRGPYRLVYSTDGLIFYTQDHYNTFSDVSKEGP